MAEDDDISLRIKQNRLNVRVQASELNVRMLILKQISNGKNCVKTKNSLYAYSLD